jgi:hypothetical protein
MLGVPALSASKAQEHSAAPLRAATLHLHGYLSYSSGQGFGLVLLAAATLEVEVVESDLPLD